MELRHNSSMRRSVNGGQLIHGIIEAIE